jgi:hypothetical protein
LLKERLEAAKEILEIQRGEAEAIKDNDENGWYMLGLFNGMEYVVSLLEMREPNFKQHPKKRS